MPEYYWDKGRGEWRKSKPMPYSGWKARLEQWFRAKKLKRLADFMSAWDERGLE